MRGTGVPTDSALLQRILNIEAALGIQGSGSNLAGFPVLDGNGLLRVRVGALPNGDYGLYLADPDTGQGTELLPVYSAFYAATLGPTVSATFVTLTNGPKLTAYLGASGDAIVTVSASITTGATGNSGAVGLLVDGAGGLDLATARQILYWYDSAGQGAASTCSRVRLSQFMNESYTPNTTHVFQLQYAAPISTAGGGAEFQDSALEVQPI